MEQTEPRTLITAEIEKLPPEARTYFDPQQPLPVTVQFFEERKTVGDIARVIAIGAGLLVVGLALIILGIFLFVLPIVGLVFVFAGGWILYSARTRRASMNAQASGQHTRYGIFLFGDTFAQYNEFGYTLIPRQEFLSVENGRVKYLVNDEEKSFDLPQAVVGADVKTMLDAIEAWRAK